MPRGAVRSRSRSQYRLGWRPPSGSLTSSEGLSLFRTFSLRFDHIGSGAYRPNPEHRRANSKFLRNSNHFHGSKIQPRISAPTDSRSRATMRVTASFTSSVVKVRSGCWKVKAMARDFFPRGTFTPSGSLKTSKGVTDEKSSSFAPSTASSTAA